MEKKPRKPRAPKNVAAIPNSFSVPSAWIVPPKNTVSRLDMDFGREDLNALRNKLNELVDIVNNL